MLLAAAVALNAFVSAFGGTWTCTAHLPGVVAAPTSTWRIVAPPHNAWTVVHWASHSERGTAFVGYLAPQQQWVYEDFRSGGAFWSETSPGPQKGVWTWSGTMVSPERIQHGAFQWRRDGTGFRLGFGRLVGPSFREAAYSSCIPARR